MKKIGYIQTSSKKYGGKVYEQQVREALSKHFDLELINLSPKYFSKKFLKAIELFFYLLKLKGTKDLWIRDFISAITLPLAKTKGENIVLIHHIDFSDSPLIFKPFFFIIQKIFYQNLRKTEAIVVVSEYWKNHFLKKGYSNVYKIYNSFNLFEFNVGEKEVVEFKKRYNLEEKPIIYIGNCQRAKGVVESYEALKGLNIYLVTSGEKKVKIPTINLSIEYRDYLRLLKASSIVVAMSKFKEGWCRTVHEAMLLKKPVIGSGLGGMKELLEGGKQIICEDFNLLEAKVSYLLNHPEIMEEMGETGFSYVKDFTADKFEKEWVNLIKKIIQ